MKKYIIFLISIFLLSCSAVDKPGMDGVGTEIGPQPPIVEPEVPDGSIDWTPIEPSTPIVPEPEVPDGSIDWTPIEPSTPIVPEPEVPKVEMLRNKFLVQVVGGTVKVVGEISADGRTFKFGTYQMYEYKTRYQNSDYSKGTMVDSMYQATGVFNKTFSYNAKNNTVNIHTDDGGVYQLVNR